MHICYLTSEYPSNGKPEGGLGNYLRKASLALIERGHQVTVFVLASRNYDAIDKGIQLRFVARMKFYWRFHRVKLLRPWFEMLEQYLNARRMHKQVMKRHRQDPIDILQTPNYKTPGLTMCHNKHFPVVCRCSSYQPLWRSANGKRKTLDGCVSDWLETKQLVDADAAFSPSAFIARVYERFEAVKPFVIRTPIELTPVNLDDSIYLNHLDGKQYLLYFGALNGVKGFDLLINALPVVLEENSDLTFVAIGRNDLLPQGVKAMDVMKGQLKDFYEQGRILYFPSLPKSQLYPVIMHAIGVVLPSRVDNYPNACLETMSLGIPVIGTYDSSLDEMIIDGKTGFLAKNNDVESLFTSMRRLMQLGDLEKVQMRENIKQSINDIVNEGREDQLVDFYNNVRTSFYDSRKSVAR